VSTDELTGVRAATGYAPPQPVVALAFLCGLAAVVTTAAIAFAARLPEIQSLAGSHFRHLDPEAREEAVQNAVVLAYRYWSRLAELGKTLGQPARGTREAVRLRWAWPGRRATSWTRQSGQRCQEAA